MSLDIKGESGPSGIHNPLDGWVSSLIVDTVTLGVSVEERAQVRAVIPGHSVLQFSSL